MATLSTILSGITAENVNDTKTLLLECIEASDKGWNMFLLAEKIVNEATEQSCRLQPQYCQLVQLLAMNHSKVGFRGLLTSLSPLPGFVGGLSQIVEEYLSPASFKQHFLNMLQNCFSQWITGELPEDHSRSILMFVAELSMLEKPVMNIRILTDVWMQTAIKLNESRSLTVGEAACEFIDRISNLDTFSQTTSKKKKKKKTMDLIFASLLDVTKATKATRCNWLECKELSSIRTRLEEFGRLRKIKWQQHEDKERRLRYLREAQERQEDSEEDQFTPYTGYYTTGDGQPVFAYAGETEDYTACSSQCGYCGRCTY
jgi:hypothetical protein